MYGLSVVRLGSAMLMRLRYKMASMPNSFGLHGMLLLPVLVPFESMHVPIRNECDLKWVHFDRWRRTKHGSGEL